MSHIYFDCAASHPVIPFVASEIYRVMVKGGNPNSNHVAGYEARQMIENAEDVVIDELGLDGRNGWLVWTSGATEANALVAQLAKNAGLNIVGDESIEHWSMARWLNRTHIGARPVVDVDRLVRSGYVGKQVYTMMTASNITGAIQPLETLASEVAYSHHDSLIHTDITQAIGKIDCTDAGQYADVITGGFHKFGGPKGVGFLYLNEYAIELLGKPFELSKQEATTRGRHYGVRTGTPPVALIHGAGEALRICTQGRTTKWSSEGMLWHEVAGRRDEISRHLNDLGCHSLESLWGDTPMLPGHLYTCFEGKTSTRWVDALSEMGLMVSAGAACDGESHKACPFGVWAGLTPHQAMSMVRMSLGLGLEDLTMARARQILSDFVEKYPGVIR